MNKAGQLVDAISSGVAHHLVAVMPPMLLDASNQAFKGTFTFTNEGSMDMQVDADQLAETKAIMINALMRDTLHRNIIMKGYTVVEETGASTTYDEFHEIVVSKMFELMLHRFSMKEHEGFIAGLEAAVHSGQTSVRASLSFVLEANSVPKHTKH